MKSVADHRRYLYRPVMATNILVIEARPNARELYTLLLKLEGYQVIRAKKWFLQHDLASSRFRRSRLSSPSGLVTFTPAV
jgi:hypothetical protein